MELSIYRYLLLSLVWPLIAPCGYYTTSYPLLLLVTVLSSVVGCTCLWCIACLLLLRASCRYRGISYLLLSLVVIVIRDVHTVATVAPRGYRQATDQPTDRRGGEFFKKGGEANRNPPRPHFYA